MAKTKHENRALFDFLQYDESVQWEPSQSGFEICLWSWAGKDYIACPAHFCNTGKIPVYQMEEDVVIAKWHCKPTMKMGKVYQSLR